MPNIKEIALKVAKTIPTVCEFDWDEDDVVKFAEALVAELANETAEACAKYVNRFLNGDGIQDEAWIRDIESGIRCGAWKEFKRS